ncbi:hypothetical protein [Rhodanobacter sp. DHB23]|uniref:hypothetical protein n=1 Tax=Rhodanobacter sp. DHB23 TaxID=2775923 RepID=UPI001783AFD9|nr:hypothetical protein [Rhodanobacter sp. DHB23]MBD8872469.1 hypothetical protein [Rhodanobacter sp. DHB23]
MSHRPVHRSTLKMTRQAMRMRFLTRDPSGPKMRRLDLLLPNETFRKLEEIMDSTNMRRREALESLILAYHSRIFAGEK